MRAPPGFRFQAGVDGLLVGLSIVFVVKLKLVVAGLIEWRLLPVWPWKPLGLLGAWVGEGVGAMGRAFGGIIRVGGSDGGATSSSILSAGVLAKLGTSVAEILGAPLLLTGSLSGGIIDQALIITGFWIAVLIPFFNWVLRPAYARLRTIDHG